MKLEHDNNGQFYPLFKGYQGRVSVTFHVALTLQTASTKRLHSLPRKEQAEDQQEEAEKWRLRAPKRNLSGLSLPFPFLSLCSTFLGLCPVNKRVHITFLSSTQLLKFLSVLGFNCNLPIFHSPSHQGQFVKSISRIPLLIITT